MTITLKSMIDYIYEYIVSIDGNQDDNIILNNISNSTDGNNMSIDWVNKRKDNKQVIVEQSKARVIICDSDIIYNDTIKNQKKVLIKVLNPRLVIAKIGNEFFIQRKIGIHKSAIIHEDAIIGENVYIGPNSSVGKCRIGNKCIIDANVVIYDDVEIGKNVRIYSGTIIGHDGMGCELDRDGSLIPFPHLGKVIIEDDVTIGANCSIAKGSLSNTVIGKNSKLNALVNISHNDVIGKHVWVSSNVNISGSVNIGDNCVIYSSSVFREGLIVGKDVLIGMGAVVTKDIPNNEVWYGNPAKKVR